VEDGRLRPSVNGLCATGGTPVLQVKPVAMPNSANPVLLYDGVCGLCNRIVQFVLKHDRRARFRFASLQSGYAAAILQRHGIDSDDLDTVYYVAPDQAPAARSDAVIAILRELGGFWKTIAAAIRILPKWLRDRGYNVVARHRYRIFGKYESCLLPEKKYQDRFLDLG
jgi:predicted DCC family thiol-disulfide oxidoreductase YuxK